MPEQIRLFRHEGDYWAIRYRAESFRVRDSKGIRHIALLLQNPGKEFHVLELAAAAAGGARSRSVGRAGTDAVSLDADGLQVSALGDAGDLLDATAKAAYRRRLLELVAEAEEAEGFNDPVRASRAREEIDALEQQLSAAFGLGGRPRKAGSAAERARVNVRNAIASALRVLAGHGPQLAEHLQKALRTGTFCWYVGDGERWSTDPEAADRAALDLPGEAEDRLLATFLIAELADKPDCRPPGGSKAAADASGAVGADHVTGHGGRLLSWAHDVIRAVFPGPAAAIACAAQLQSDLQALEIRSGVHTGECAWRDGQPSGVSFDIAGHISAAAAPGDILVSSTVREILAGSGIEFADKGFHSFRGVPGTWRLFAIAAPGRSRKRPAGRRGTPNALSLMVVDDHPMWRQTLRAVLEGSGVGMVVAEASDGDAVADIALAARPETVIMDMNLGATSGAKATRHLLAALPDTKVLMLSSSDERADVVEAVQAGASGYLLKTAGPEEVADAVERIRAGELVFPPALAKVVLEEFRRLGRARTVGAATGARTAKPRVSKTAD